MTAIEAMDEGVKWVTLFTIGMVAMTLVGSVLFYQARGAMKAVDAWLFAIFATALLALPFLVDGSWTWPACLVGMALMLFWLWRAEKREDKD